MGHKAFIQFIILGKMVKILQGGNKLLQSMYKIFEEVPKHHEKYEIALAKMLEYPLQFCLHHWLENEIVAKRAIEIWPRMVELVRFWKGLSKSNQPREGVPGANTGFDHLKKAINGPRIPIKLAFFRNLLQN